MLVERLHAVEGAVGDGVDDLPRLRWVEQQLLDARGDHQHLERRDPAAADARHEPLAHDPLQRVRE